MSKPYFYMIIIVLSFIILLPVPSSYAKSGSTFFMKPNSTAKIYANFTFPVPNNETRVLKPQILSSLTDPNSFADGLNIDVVPSLLPTNKNNVSVTYTITAKSDTRGVYAVSLYLCGLSPLVVGFNESEVSPLIFSKFFAAIYSCPSYSQSTPTIAITGYSGMISKIVSINPNSTNNQYLVNQLGQLPESPLKQFESGVKPSDIKCMKDFLLITKNEDGTPACVTTSTAIVLAERGWTTDVKIHNPSD